MEKSGDFGRRVMEGTASEGAEYEGVMSMEKSYAEDCADLSSCSLRSDERWRRSSFCARRQMNQMFYIP